MDNEDWDAGDQDPVEIDENEVAVESENDWFDSQGEENEE